MAFTTKPISAVVGALTAITSVAVITSHSNATATFVCNSVTYPPVTFTICGNDRATADDAGVTHAFYFATVSITGLTTFKNYAWSVTQGVNSDSGTFYNSPSSKASKFSIAPVTCFNPQGGVLTDAEDPFTAFDFLDYYADHTEYPLVAILFTDDLYYADGIIAGTVVGTYNAQGKKFVTNNNSAGTRPSYDFALHYGMWFGILDSFRNPSDSAPKLNAARSEAWQRLKNKTAIMPQWGDHEFQDNLGWLSGSLLTAVPNGFHQAAAGDRLGKGLVVYEQLMTPLQGTRARSADTVANHWYADFGPLRYITPDPTTNAVYASSICFGTNQINDCLTIAAAGSQWFTLIGNPAMAGRGTPNYDAALNTFNSSLTYSYKNENYFSAEYNRWWLNTGQTPKSLLDSSRTNGNLGATVMTRGDNHFGAWYYWKAPAAAGVTAESIHEICLNTVNASAASDTQWLTGGGGADFASDNCELIGGISSYGNNIRTFNYCVTIIEIDGTLPTPQMVIKQWQYVSSPAFGDDLSPHFINDYETMTDAKGAIWRVMAQRKFKLYGGNYGTDLTETGYEMLQTSSAGIL